MEQSDALSQSEIQQYMSLPPTGSEAGLVGYWNFEEGTGSVVTDLSGNGNNGTINGASWSNDVPNQTCVGCTASDSVYVELTELNFDLGADTISLCDTATTLDAGSGYGKLPMVDRGNDTNNRCGLFWDVFCNSRGWCQ